MSLKYIDAHCHLQFDQYEADRDQVAQRMCEEGIGGIVVGCDLESSRRAVELAEKYDHLYASVGLHPTHVGFTKPNIEELAKQGKVVAIGECGLDYFRPVAVTEAVVERQKTIFRQQAILAAELDLPLIIHARPSQGSMDAYEDTLAILRDVQAEYPNLRGDSHFFAGTAEVARAFVAINFTLSFTGVVTFARDYDEAIRAIPQESILVETDAPYVAPKSRRGQRNDSLSIPEIAAKLAEIRGEEPEAFRLALLENTSRLFKGVRTTR